MWQFCDIGLLSKCSQHGIKKSIQLFGQQGILIWLVWDSLTS
jgi:hypothetical protein